ncbi:hypothetical protein [Lysobacter brunescens]|uniref:Lipoprotein n=1 Tax=Lysobacter brunescens TaxID=262323 RepID=A0ABW2YAX4_9GAMM
MPPVCTLALCVALVTACAGDAPPADRTTGALLPAAKAVDPAPASMPAPAPVPLTREQALDRFAGDWMVTKAVPTDADESISVFIRREGDALAIFEGGIRELDVRIASFDPATGALSLVETLPDGTVALTMTPLDVSASVDSVKRDVLLAWDDGVRWTLTGGALPTDPEAYSNDVIQSVRARGRRGVHRVENIACGENASLRHRILCEDTALRHRHFELMEQFMAIGGEYPDSHRTYQAAIRDLDTCTDKACVAKGIDTWSRYLDDNYPGQQMVD